MKPTPTLVIDTSALVCILLQEPDAAQYLDALTDADEVLMSAVTRVELGVVTLSRGTAAVTVAEDLLKDLQVKIVDFSAEHAGLAVSVSAEFGKGRHPAALNFGDCCSYALAKSLNLPLLYKGNDFSRTDIRSALA